MSMLKRTLVVATLGLLFGAAGTIDYESALIVDAFEKEQRPLRVARANRELDATFPIHYDATVTQSLPSGREPVTRYYTRSSTNGKQ